ncbi:MAG TPA: hypothetical protein PLF87_09905 [Syntrophorhabdaceae bacterium]|jgi:hypothetical protein|nr:hypothetical protein [Syntrophorhabdaceae bacterium]HQM77510.1 hypothetical protein [Syntrophorhabdaceae bacterium]
MTEKHGSPIETLGDDRKERGRGFEESRVQVEKDRRQRTEDRGQRAEGRGQKTGDKRQETEVRGQRTESSTTLSFPQVFSGNPEDVMVPR